jgi:hypothetical protein
MGPCSDHKVDLSAHEEKKNRIGKASKGTYEIRVPPRTLLFSKDFPGKNLIKVVYNGYHRTAVSSIVLSSSSTLPPGREVSPAYVLSVADRLVV